MQTENQSSKPETSPQQRTGEGCSGASCSASSDTPETDGKCLTWYPGTCTLGHEGRNIDGRVVLADFARKLEVERNAYRDLCARGYNIAMGDADPSDVDDYITDYNAIISSLNSEIEPTPTI
jgi:hypothetical protein